MGQRTPPGEPAPPRAEQLERIDRALEQGDFARALRHAERALSSDAEDPELHHARGVALRGLGRVDEAIDAFSRALDRNPGLADAWLDAAELFIEDLRDDVRALELLQTAARHVGELPELLTLRGLALAHLEDLTGALAVLDRAVALDADDPDTLTERAAVLVELLRTEEGEGELRRALELDPEHVRAHQLLAFVLDWTGRRDEASRHFERAGRLDPELPERPPRLSETEFDAVLETALAALPPEFAAELRNVEIAVENYADRELCRHDDCSPMSLGLYIGTPITVAEVGSPDLPGRILLFQRALENQARDEKHLIEEIVITLKHEIGHHLGFEEDDLAARGYD